MKKHTVTISNNFVRNVKRMWDSPFASYKEIIQNALRAGAKTIQVSYNADQTLIVEDDGQGFDDIDSLLTIGDSGWGDEVVEPAGVGIFAAPAFAEEVTIQSGKTKLVLTGTLFEDGYVEERETKTAISGTRVVVKGIKLDKNQVDTLRGYVDVDFYFNRELIPNPLENEDYIPTPYGRLYLQHHAEHSSWQYTYNARVVWEGYPLDACYITLPGIWVVDTQAVPGELRPQLPHRDRLIQNEVYHKTIKEINDFFDNWAANILSQVDIKKMPGRGKYEKIAVQLEKEVDREQIPGALVLKTQEYFYTKLSIPILEEPTIDWEGAFGYVDDFEKETIYTRNDLVLEIKLPCEDYDGFPQMLINVQAEQPLLVKFVEKKKQSNFMPINLHKQEGGWYCDGWELDGGYLPGIEVMIWPTREGDRIVYAGQPAHLASHALNNAELWSLALTWLNNEIISRYWGDDGGGFVVLPGEVLVDVYRSTGKEENDARIYVKLQQVKKILTEYGLPENFRKLALDNLHDLEKTFCTAGYVPPENAGPIFSF